MQPALKPPFSDFPYRFSCVPYPFADIRPIRLGKFGKCNRNAAPQFHTVHAHIRIAINNGFIVWNL